MKNFSKASLLIISVLCINGILFAQGSTREINYEGLKIILKKTAKEVTTVDLFIKGGVANIDSTNQGIEALALRLAMSGGTKNMDKNAFSTLADKLGTHFGSSASKDFSSLTMTCLQENWNQSWDMFMDAINNPAMDENEFGVIKQQMVSAAKQADANPDSYLRKLATEQIFKGTPYALSPNGVPSSLEKISLAEVKKYYSKLLGKKKCFLVVVGDIDEQDLLGKLKNSLAKLPVGSLPAKPILKGVTMPEVDITDRSSMATNYILGTVNGPKYFSADGPLFEFAMRILYDRYFVELRTKRSLSYAPQAYYNFSMIHNPVANLYISTIDPKKSLEVMTEIIDDIKKNGFTTKEVEDKKKEYLTDYYMTNEASGSQAAVLGLCEASGNWRIFDEINSKIEEVKPTDLSNVFNKYMNNIAWTYLGKKDKVTESDFKQPIASKEKLQPSKMENPKKE